MRSPVRARLIASAIALLVAAAAGVGTALPAAATGSTSSAGPSVTGFTQSYQSKQGGRVSVGVGPG